jgi:hypothetical protein
MARVGPPALCFDASTVWQSIAWSLGLLAFFIPLAVWAYGRRTSR